MALDLLGEGFDLHGSGQDVPPTTKTSGPRPCPRCFAHHWTHNGYRRDRRREDVKSLGSFTNLLDLIDSTDRAPLLVLRSHYRSPIEVNQANAEDATRRCASSTSSRRASELASRPTPRRSTSSVV
jgi:cysteinyl-tRNA synthetase